MSKDSWKLLAVLLMLIVFTFLIGYFLGWRVNVNFYRVRS